MTVERKRRNGLHAIALPRVPGQSPFNSVIPAKAGIQGPRLRCFPWIPAFAGMTGENEREGFTCDRPALRDRVGVMPCFPGARAHGPTPPIPARLLALDQ